MKRGRRDGRVRRFAQSEDGGATIEACLWLPFLATFFMLVIDASFIFMRQADAQRIVQDGARQFVAGAIDTETELKTWLEAAMTPISTNATATVQVDPITGYLTARVEYPAKDTDLSGVSGVLGAAQILVQSIQITEQ